MTLLEILKKNPKALDPLARFSVDSTQIDYLVTDGVAAVYEYAAERIIDECGDFQILYDTAEKFTGAVMLWTASNRYRFERVLTTLYYKYNPVHNFDRIEEQLEGAISKTSGESSGSTEGTVNRTGKVAGYNAETLTARDGDEQDAKSSGTSTHKSSGENYVEKAARIYGNVGVTTTQQMIDEERRMLMFDFGSFITSEFKKKFCILVY